VQKNGEIPQNMGNFGFGALFSDNVSMTSSGGVEVGLCQHDVIG